MRDSPGILFFLFISIFIQPSLSVSTKVFLNGNDWTFVSNNDSTKTGSATVPGDIYTDLWKAGLIDDPIKDTNDVQYQWVGRTDWSYSKTIDLSAYSSINAKQIWLRFDGLDTIASVYINSVFLFQSINQFVDYNFDIKSYVLPGKNTITVKFQSSVGYSGSLAVNYRARFGHYVPPDCPLPIQNGECHPNFIRKSQASFSWDWGPSYPTSGIWSDVYLEYVPDQVSLKGISPLLTFDSNSNNFTLLVEADVFCLPKSSVSFSLSASLPEIATKQSTNFKITCDSSGISTVSYNITVPQSTVSLWWPNGYGQQKLYDLLIQTLVDGTVTSSKSKRIGFRYVELIQDFVDEKDQSKGRNFYFKVNNVPIFLKGSNLIEIENFYGRNFTQRTHFLLDSVKEANMNALRVWGGGIFEPDFFYEKADENGILLWHDMLFACALYPVDQDFLSNVHTETVVQVRRLRYHPSILTWAGNNENELAIMSGWWYVPNYSSANVIKDYITLYKDTIGPVVKSLDPSRPYLLSSPSNGINSEDAGGVGQDPNSEHYGDIHFYNEFINLWKDGSYSTPRCATEFGVQSIPSKNTMLSQINESEYYYTSQTMTSRQHHTGGIATLVTMTFSHFDHPSQCTDQNLQTCPYIHSDPSFLAPFSYLTQIHQALAMQVQSEHYRRWRGRYDSGGKGNTMCALYWQLNDVWAAPSWASIDYNQEWKVLHYVAKRFFAPIVVSLYLDGNGLLAAYVVSDSTKDVKSANLEIQMLAWTNGFQPVVNFKKTIDVSALKSNPVDIDTSFQQLQNSPNDFVVRATLKDSAGNDLAPTAVLHPDKFYGLKSFGNVSITNLKKIDDLNFEITVASTAVAPFVWIDLTPEFKKKNPETLFRFSDNSFTTTQSEVTVQLKFTNLPKEAPTLGDLTKAQLMSCEEKSSLEKSIFETQDDPGSDLLQSIFSPSTVVNSGISFLDGRCSHLHLPDSADPDIRALKEGFAEGYGADYYFPSGDIRIIGRDRKTILISLLHAAVTSDFFILALSPRFSDSGKRIVTLPDFDAVEIVDAFELNNYVLSKWLKERGTLNLDSNVNIDFDHMNLSCAFNVMKTAAFLQMEYLLEVLKNQILKKIKTTDLVRAFRDSQGLDGGLAKELWKKILKHFDEIYTNGTFLELEEKEILECIRDPTVNLLWTKDEDVLSDYMGNYYYDYDNNSNLNEDYTEIRNYLTFERTGAFGSHGRSRIPQATIMAQGGWGDGGPTSVVEFYDYHTEQWKSPKISAESIVESPRAYHGLLSTEYGLMIMGGFNGRSYYRTVSVLEKDTLEWTACCCTTEPRCYVSMGIIDKNNVIASGGYTGYTRLKTAEVYNFVRNQWIKTSPMSTIRSDSRAVSFQNLRRTYMVGGFDGKNCHKTIEYYDPDRDQWITESSHMSVKRSGVGAVGLMDNLIVVMGGFNGNSRLSSAEFFDLREGRWHMVSSMNNPRSNFGVAVLNNAPFVLGGYNQEKTIKGVERLELRKNTWIKMPDLETTRSALACCTVEDPDFIDKVIERRDNVLINNFSSED
ncbi:hypothetical protein FO519_005638 [Halicephalobus sp. NKZ332]|nr:hypothetical protein FO519_005638 [Halicephalobus sp. NKZ332]